MTASILMLKIVHGKKRWLKNYQSQD